MELPVPLPPATAGHDGATPTHVDGDLARDRTSEWFVPRFGPRRFRVAVGLLFLPYTGMVLAFTVLGALLAPRVDWERVAALLLVYGLALGVAAHALDALASRTAKPWGEVFSRRSLVAAALVSLLAAYTLGAWYMQRYAPWLWPIAIAEGVLLLAYNLEWLDGRFHTDAWFALAWGGLPSLAGYVLQTNRVSAASLVLAGATATLALVEIKASRPYKALKRKASSDAERAHVRTLEAVLKSISLGTMLLAMAGALARWGA